MLVQPLTPAARLAGAAAVLLDFDGLLGMRGWQWVFIVTGMAAVLLPFEVYELHERVSPLKVIGFLINLAVVVYLIYAKRLFGVRGGHPAEAARKAELSGWPAIEAAQAHLPGVPVG